MLLSVATCSNPTGFRCVEHGQCIGSPSSGLGASGRCEPNGGCSFPDALCASGRRFGVHTATALAGRCIESMDASTNGDGPYDDAAPDATPVDAMPADGPGAPDGPDAACVTVLPTASWNLSQRGGVACTVDGILNSTGNATGLDYSSASLGLGTFDGQAVSGCVAGQFASLPAGARITVQASLHMSACGYPCSVCNLYPALLVFYSSDLDVANFKTVATITPATSTLTDYSVTLPASASYVILCRNGAGPGAQDLLVMYLRACM